MEPMTVAQLIARLQEMANPETSMVHCAIAHDSEFLHGNPVMVNQQLSGLVVITTEAVPE